MKMRLPEKKHLKENDIWGTIFNFEEDEKELIEKGKSADFIIINQNIMKIESDIIPHTKVLKTFI